ncbi:MAG: ATP-binding protein [Defluviitaleaceae bacterium]|nr:ATP-binding protein [Defluviitaleaceae bacterium]
MLLEDRINSFEDETIKKLWSSIKKITEDSNKHLLEITTQLPGFDIHDASHSEEVLSNIEKLLQAEGIDKLTPLECLFLYASAYMHDAAMALPKWEFDLLLAVEGTDKVCDNKKALHINNDFKPVHEWSFLNEYICKNKNSLYTNFDTASKFVFSPETEEKLIEDLIDRVREYEEFRNGYTDKLRALLATSNQEYLKFSDLIRHEFIRVTHHTRVEQYIMNLKKFLANEIGSSAKANQFAESLAKICRSHGEGFDFVKAMNPRNKIWKDNYVNEQYVSMLLRLGDIIHFSSNRAPLSLFAEKQITDSVSLKHWKAKFQELSYEINVQNSKTQINFSAYCSEPEIYYFIQDYIDDIDNELMYYRNIIENYRFIRYEFADEYELPFEFAVNRSDVLPDEEIFIPEPDAKFTLEQSKILKLLMGVQLYKDKYLCLRELYQNSLDACKCMLAKYESDKIIKEFEIEIGLKHIESKRKNESFVYFFDNGTGMTREIVRNHLLKIGNSYYKSKDFMRHNAGWANKVAPTSQFGIGILSCYMIGKRIEITTKHYESDEIFSFSLDGINERFYYIKPERQDKERIGQHGTIVKIFLNEETQNVLDNKYYENMEFLIRHMPDEIYNSLFYNINKQIGFPHKKISVSVCDNDGIKHPIFGHADFLDYSSLSDEDISIFVNLPSYNTEQLKEFMSAYNSLECVKLEVSTTEVELYGKMYLPKNSTPSIPLEALTQTLNDTRFPFSNFSNLKAGLYVDGISIGNIYAEYGDLIDKLHRTIGYKLCSNLFINCIGEYRPVLSVDRTDIVSFDEKLIENIKGAIDLYIESLSKTVNGFLLLEKIDVGTYQFDLLSSLIVYLFPGISSRILLKLHTDAEIQGINIEDDECSVYKLFKTEKMSLATDIRGLNDFGYTLLMIKFATSSYIEVKDMDILLDASISFSECLSENNCYSISGFRGFVIKADIWDGLYQEYDMVSSLFPLIPVRLYEKTEENKHTGIQILQNRIKSLSHSINDSIVHVSLFEPAFINPSTHGISRNYSEKRVSNRINKRGNVLDFSMDYIFKDYPKDANYVLFAFISPNELNADETESLKNCTDEIYVRGVREGWSILFIGSNNYTIMPGHVQKADIITKAITEHGEFIEQNKSTLFNIDDTLAFSDV